MMSTLDLRGRELTARALRDLMPRAELDVEAALAAYRDARAELRAAEVELDRKLKAAGFDA